MTSRVRWCVSWAVVALLGCSSSESTNRRPAVLGELREIARIGSVDGAPELQFSEPGALVVDRETEELFVADPLAREIRVFNRNGTFLRRFGRAGQGPGEFDAEPVFAMARDTIVVMDRSRVHVFDREGALLGTGSTIKTVDGLPLPMAVVSDSEGWIAWTMELDPYDPEMGTFERFYRIDVNTKELGELIFELRHDEDEMGILTEQQRATPTGHGFVLAPGPAYELVYFEDSALERDTLRFPWEPVAVSADAFETYTNERRASCDGSPSLSRCLERVEERIADMADRPLPVTRPVIGGLIGSREGLVLILRADLDPNPFRNSDETRWDLVNTQGEFLAELAFPPTFRPRWLGRDEIWGFEIDQLNVPYVVGYRIAGRR